MKNYLKIIALIFCSLQLMSQESSKKTQPNILVFLVDDMSADELSCYGNTLHNTPIVDQLAKDGVRFETCWATPLCSPSRSLIMTGRYGYRTGWYANRMKKNEPLPNENIIFSQLLQEVGYRTAIAGKWQLPGKPPAYGFDTYCLWGNNNWLPEGVAHPGVETLDSTKYNYMKPARFWHPMIVKDGEYTPTTVNDYGPDVNTDFLIDFMTEESEKPFLAYYSMVLTHDPFYPTPETLKSESEKFGASNQDRNYKANVEYMDKCVGRILSELEAKGLRENTLVLLTGDNGTWSRGKSEAKEIGVREPLIVHWPGKIEKQGVKRELVDFSDIFPTLAEVGGAKIPDDYVHDGRSFLPLLRGKEYNEREFIFSYLDTRRLVRDKRWLLEGDGRLFDCGENRDPRGYVGYKEVTDSNSPEVEKARKRIIEFLKDKPAPSGIVKK